MVHHDDYFPKDRDTKLEKVNKHIKRQIKVLTEKKEDIKNQLTEIDNKICEIRRYCLHTESSEYNDGNGEHWSECHNCGATF